MFMKLNSKYRIKTKEEFIRDGQWDYKYNTPIGWNDAKKMNQFLGSIISSKLNSKCNNRLSLKANGWTFYSNDYVKLSPAEIPAFRFKTENEFRLEEEWNFVTNRPYGWDANVIGLMGQPIPIEYNGQCLNKSVIKLCDVVFNASDYTNYTLVDVMRNNLIGPISNDDIELPMYQRVIMVIAVLFITILFTSLIFIK